MTIEIPLSQGKVVIIDEADVELVRRHKWFANSTRGRTFYALTNIMHPGAIDKRTTLSMHRLILGLAESYTQVDHIDGNGLNNRRSNLRICSNSENARNRRKRIDNTSGYKGVSFDARSYKWVAYINFDGKRMHIGYFNTREDAHAAYCKAATKLHGEFANYG